MNMFRIDTEWVFFKDHEVGQIAFLDQSATVDIIKNAEIIERPRMELPKELRNVISCKNPRCITSTERELDQVFVLTDPKNGTYRCRYCETRYK